MAVWLWGKCLRGWGQRADVGAARGGVGGLTGRIGLVVGSQTVHADGTAAIRAVRSQSRGAAVRLGRDRTGADARDGRWDRRSSAGAQARHELSHRKAGRRDGDRAGDSVWVVTMAPRQSGQRLKAPPTGGRSMLAVTGGG